MVAVKICGLTDPEAIAVAAAEGAAYLGFVFYPPSPRALSPERFAALRAAVPAGPRCVGVFVDPEEELLARVLAAAPLDWLQLHGGETPERVAALKAAFGLPVIKALRVAATEDLDACAAFETVADMFLFDAPPPRRAGALPGGNAEVFDWDLLARLAPRRPWILAGGLEVNNLDEAVRRTGARIVDVSSGVETAPGVKDPARIRAFLRRARQLDPRAGASLPEGRR